MNEEGDTPTAPEAVQYTPIVSHNDEIAPKMDNKMTMFQRVGSFIGRKKSKAAEPEEDIVALLTKELEDCRRERDRFKIAHLTSEAEKKELITEMNCVTRLKSAEIEKLESTIEYEAKLKTSEMESLKVTQSKAEIEWKSLISKMESDVNLKAKEIEFLQKMEADLKSSMTRMESDLKTKSEEIDNLKRKLEDEMANSKLESDKLNEKLEAIRYEFDRYKISGDESRDLRAARSQALEIVGRCAFKAFNNMYIHRSEWRVQLSPSYHVWTIAEQNGKISIRTDGMGCKYLRAHLDDGRVDLADAAQAWEMWTPVKNDDDTWSFRSHHGTWLSVDRVTLCTKPHKEQCERFRLQSYPN